MKHRNPPLLFHNEKQSEGIFFFTALEKKTMKNKNVKIEQSKLTQRRFFPRGAPM